MSFNPSVHFKSFLILISVVAAPQIATADVSVHEERLAKGAAIYRAKCASCHGEKGEGGTKQYSEPLAGDASRTELVQLISDTMPEEDPGTCVGEDAEAVAAFVFEHFYSAAAQIRNRPPRVGLARLTGPQLRQSLADLYSHFRGTPQVTEKRGVKAIYFDGPSWKNEKKKIERVDPVIQFDFGHNSPGDGIDPKAFYIYWEGGVLANVTGRYEIIVRSTCSFVMDFGKIGRELINNHVQSGDKTEFRRTVTLTTGRVYPFKIDFIQRERKTEKPPASISLSWIPPGGTEQLIPKRNLISDVATPTFSLELELPPDDRSYGFERGVAINRQWDESTTAASIEFAQAASDELWPEYRKKHKQDSNENRGQLRAFLTEIVEIAFRAPLDEELKQRYIDHQVDTADDDAEAIQRSLLVSLKSPRFLYPLADQNQSLSTRQLNRLTLTLFDSLPTDDWLIKKIRKNELEQVDTIRSMAREFVKDFRTRAKLHDMLLEWLNVKRFDEIIKDENLFAGFDRLIVCDLRDSFEVFLNTVVESETSDYRQLFLADWTFTTDRLAKFYGDSWQPLEKELPKTEPIATEPIEVEPVSTAPTATEPVTTEPPKAKSVEKKPLETANTSLPELRRSVSDSQLRFGVLSHPYLMSGLSYHDATSPIHRGVFLIRYILGRTLRPPNEAFTPLSPDLHPDLTTRERVSLQTSPDHCQVCHTKINGLGFALENFDAVGKFRDQERTKTLDSTGKYVDRNGAEFSFSGPRELADYIVSSEDAHRAFVTRAFQHFVKQPAAAFGTGTLDELTDKFRKNNFNINELIVEIAVIAATRDPSLSK